MSAIPISPTVHWIGENDAHTKLFEGMWPLPSGVCYNSYFIDDAHTAVIDAISASCETQYLHKLKKLLNGRPLDYLVVNHMEPDHSGAITALKKVWPALKIVGNAKTIDMIDAFYGIKDDTVTIKDGDTLDLGHHKLAFALVPMVHWPETMVTYDATEKILFSCDAFGGFGALKSGIFDDEADLQSCEDDSLRYYACIVGRYSQFAQKAVQKVRTLDIKIIAPSHGPVWRTDPQKIIGWYDDWSSNKTREGCVVVYGSMYGNTKKAAQAIAASIAKSVPVTIYDASTDDMSVILRDIWRNRGLVLAACTYNMEVYPPMAKLVRALANRMMKGRKVGLLGSYSWSKGALAEMQCVFKNEKGWEIIEPNIEIKSAPKAEDFQLCELLGANMAKAVKN